jgi:hypothetical protein
MLTKLSSSANKNKVFKEEHTDKKGYLTNELESLGIEAKRKNELINNKEELEQLADNIKQAMFQDYKTGYSEKDEEHKDVVGSTLTV